MVRTGAVWFLVAAVGVCAGGAQQSKSAFDGAAIRRIDTMKSNPPKQNISSGGVFETRTNVVTLLFAAYDISPLRMVGLPDWTKQEVFDISARTSSDASAAQMRPMLQSLLESRFQ